MTSALKKRIRHHRKELLRRKQLEALGAAILRAEGDESADLDQERQRVIAEYVSTNQYKTDFLSGLRDEIRKGLSFVHDYKQLNARITQHINVVIESRYDGLTFEERLAKSSKNELAIYWASKLMAEKLNTARFLLDPDWINRPSECVSFRFHGVVHKYLKLYDAMFAEKGARLRVPGESWNTVIANPEAVGVIPHTFLDNALKYTPHGAPVEVLVQDEGSSVAFAVSSYGPKIQGDETHRIFEAFYRGREARKIEEEGAGYGLYVAQLIAKSHLGASISVEQDLGKKFHDRVLTTFSLIIPPHASGIPG